MYTVMVRNGKVLIMTLEGSFSSLLSAVDEFPVLLGLSLFPEVLLLLLLAVLFKGGIDDAKTSAIVFGVVAAMLTEILFFLLLQLTLEPEQRKNIQTMMYFTLRISVTTSGWDRVVYRYTKS